VPVPPGRPPAASPSTATRAGASTPRAIGIHTVMAPAGLVRMLPVIMDEAEQRH